MGDLKQKAASYLREFDDPGALTDRAVRYRKADKIRVVLEAEGALPDRGATLLDIGCSFGLILERLCAEVGLCVGIDLDRGAMRAQGENIRFVSADGEGLPFADGSFGIVICNHTYEHTDDASQLVSEIERVLAPGGVCYFAGPNKYDLVEPHYRLPFLSWLPRPVADRYVRAAGRGSGYPEKPLSYPRLLRLLERFHLTDYTARIVADPARFHVADILPPHTPKHAVARAVLRFAPQFFPDFVFVLRKRAAAGAG